MAAQSSGTPTSITQGRISATFAKAKSEGRAALIVYLTAGDPDSGAGAWRRRPY
jgi:hypothetical protein